MILSNPQDIRVQLAEQREWLTIDEIAKGLNAGARTIQKALEGKPVRPRTVRKIAQALNRRPTEIATFN